MALGTEGPPIQICLIGSAACILGGMAGRTSQDLDVWEPASDYDMPELKRAVEKANLEFNPTSLLEPTLPYIQIVEPGLTQLGTFTPVRLMRLGRLHLLKPPIENLIASKLIRCAEKDIADIRYLISQYVPALDQLPAIIATFPPSAQEQARENLVYLEIFK